MKNLVALARKVYSDTFVRIQGTRTHNSAISKRRRFTMESLESRVLLSAELNVIPPWIGEPAPTGPSALIQPLTSDEPTGVLTHDEGEAAPGDDVIMLIDDIALDDEIGPGADLAVGLIGNEPTIAINPLNPNNIAVAQFNAGQQTMRISLDGGLTFPIVRNAVLVPGQTSFNGDDSLAFDSAGRLFWSYLSNGTPTGPNISVVQVNPTTGAIVGSPALVATNNLDKGWIAADANPLSPFANNLYAIWHDFAQANSPVRFARSTDQGVTWTTLPGNLSGAGQGFVWPSEVAVAPNGDVFVAWHTNTGAINGDIRMRRSTDGGLTFGPETIPFPTGTAATTTNSGTGLAAKITGLHVWLQGSMQPRILIDPTLPGNIYVVSVDDPDTFLPTDDPSDIVIARSTDNGVTWTRSTISQGLYGDSEFMPSASINSSGDLTVTWYDTRRHLTVPDSLGGTHFLLDLSAATSFDGGLTFSYPVQVNDTANPFDPERGAPDRFGNHTLRIGEYNGVVLVNTTANAVWAGNSATGQQVYYDRYTTGLTVASTVPGDGLATPIQPTTFIVNVSNPIDPATVQASDFKVNGFAANSSSYLPGTTAITFSFGLTPVSAQGLQTMHIDAGAFTRAFDGDPLRQFDGTFRYDTVLLQVTSTVPPIGGMFILPGPFTYDVTFNEAVDPASVQASDLQLSGIIGATASAVALLPGNTRARFTLTGITTEGTLTASIAAGAITDVFGNPGANFSATYPVDVFVAPYATPLIAKNPLGSLIYDPSMTGLINFAGDTDTFTLNIDPGQTISVKVTPTAATLQPSVRVIDPSSATIGSHTAGSANQNALIQTVAASAGGTYQIVVSGAGGTLGGYTLQVTLNAALENEGNVVGATNNSLTSTERIIDAADSGWIQSNGTHMATNNNYLVGISGGEFRNYATFNLSPVIPTILGAELRLFNPPTGYASADPTEAYTLFDVSTTAAALDANRVAGDLTGIGIFNDLGTGTVYGTRVVSLADNNTTVAITLNAAAVAALNAAIGSTISLGGAITTLVGLGQQALFGFTTGAVPSVQLVLQTVSTNTAENIDSSFITLSTPQASAKRGAVLGQIDATTISVGFEFEDISATGTVIAGLTNQDNASVSIPVGFAFPFYGVNNTAVFVSSNGLLTFGAGNTSGVNTDLTIVPAQATIAPFWDDLHTAGGVAGSNVFFQVLGAGADQHLTIQWNKVRFATGGTAGDTITFQAQLYADGRIQFNYSDLLSGTAPGNNGTSATVGTKAAGTQGPNRLLLVFNNGPATPNVGTSRSTLILPNRPPDYYAFTLNAGDTATLAATALTTGNVTVQLRDSSDTVLSTGVGSANLTSVISDFAVTTGGTYYARITGDTLSTQYSLVVMRNAAFDTEDNNIAATAQTLTATQGALGGIFAAVTINAVDSGWIIANGTHAATNNNYIVGQGIFIQPPPLPPIFTEFRNYAAFNLSASTPNIIGAELRFFNPATGYNSPDSTETYTLFDVSATPADLDVTRTAGDPTGIAIHSDLGSGTVYGTRVVSAADANTTVAITLNAAAVAALNAAIGSTISFGGALTTLTANVVQFMFSGTTGAPGTVQLVLQTIADDWYSITLPATANALRLETSTPGAGPGEPVNTLNPKIELYDGTGTTLIASGVAGPDGRNESIAAFGLTPGGTYKVRVNGESGTRGEYFLTRNFSNFIPVLTNVAVASPINENDTATVTGTFTDADVLDTHTVIVTWGPGEGSTTLTLAAGTLTFSATHQYLDDNPSGTSSDVYPISVTVTDNHLGSASGGVDLTVNNVAPVVAPISGPSSGVRGQALAFTGAFTDVGSLDTHEVRWDFGDGNVVDFHSTADPDALTPAHVYTDNGVYTITLSIRDDDGDLTSVSKAVEITAVAIQVDPCDDSKTALVVGGTTGNDTISFAPVGNLGDIAVYINDVSEGVFHPTGHLIAYGQDGDDDIQIAGSIGLDALLYGDAGNDRLKSGAGAGILLGGDGDDQLNGGSGRDILIGGRGMDRVIGAGGDDLLIGGFTSYDGNAVFLCTIMDEWKSTVDGYAVRVAKLRLLLDDTTVLDDGDVDRLTGTSGQDWFFIGLDDVITVTQDGESIG